MAVAGLQPQLEGELPSAPVHVSAERLAEFDRLVAEFERLVVRRDVDRNERLVAGDGITAIICALEREREQRTDR